MKKILLSLTLILLTFALTVYCATYTSQYPTQDADHVKATTKVSEDYWPYFATDPAKSLIGAWASNSWLAPNSTEQRFHINLGSAKIIKRIYYENNHESGASTDIGVQNFTFWGSNTAGSFAELTYAIDTGWTQITTAQGTFDEHSAANEADPKYITVTNSIAYRYYAFKFVDNYGFIDYMGPRRIELQTEDAVGITWNTVTITKWNTKTITTPINTQ